MDVVAPGPTLPDAAEIQGPKWLWASVAAVVNPAGVVPLTYFVFGGGALRGNPAYMHALRAIGGPLTGVSWGS
jgi:hypothetical protein